MNAERAEWSYAQSIAALKKQITKGEKILRLNDNGISYELLDNWQKGAEHYLCKAFGEKNPQSTVLSQKFVFSFGERSDAEIAISNAQRLRSHLGKVASALEILETEEELSATGNIDRATRISFGNKVFLVHGRDEGAKQQVARFLEKIKMDVVILSELPDKGRTIIEKF